MQAMGQQSEYMRATTASTGSGGGSAASDNKSEISKLINDKHKLLQQLDDAKAEAATAGKNLAAVKAQAQVRRRHQHQQQRGIMLPRCCVEVLEEGKGGAWGWCVEIIAVAPTH